MSAFRFEIAMKCYYYLSCGDFKVKSFFLSKVATFYILNFLPGKYKNKDCVYVLYGALK